MKLTQLPNGNWIDKTRITHLQIQAPTHYPNGSKSKDQVGIWLHEGTEWLEFDSKQAAVEFRDRLASMVNASEVEHKAAQTMDPEELAHECVRAIQKDLKTRRSLRNVVFIDMQPNVRSSLFETWEAIVANVVNGSTPKLNQVPNVRANSTRTFAEDCMKAIEDDLKARPSLSPAFLYLHPMVRDEIMASWTTIIEEKLRSL